MTERSEEDYYEKREAREDNGLINCDDLSCPAKLAPKTLEEWRDVAIHWESHSYMSGCSHGQ